MSKMTYSKQAGTAVLNAMLKQHRITVCAWSSTSCGYAIIKERKIKIPKPTNADRFGVCMHEVKHIIDGNKGKRYQQEFWADKFAREQMVLVGCSEAELHDWDRRTNWHVLSRIAMAHNRGLKRQNLTQEVRDFFDHVDFDAWLGQTVFVQHDEKQPLCYRIKLTVYMSFQEIKDALRAKDFGIHKSTLDDSSYGLYCVHSIDKEWQYGMTFRTLPDIVEGFKLQPDELTIW